MRDMVCSALEPASLAVSSTLAAASDTVLAPSLAAAETDFVAGSTVVVVAAIPISSENRTQKQHYVRSLARCPKLPQANAAKQAGTGAEVPLHPLPLAASGAREGPAAGG